MESYLKEKYEYKYTNPKIQSEFEWGETPVYTIDNSGNVLKNINFKLHLTKNGVPITRDYWNFIELSEDHYAVCDVQVSGCCLETITEPLMVDMVAHLQPKFQFKYGVIRLQRDKNGEVIPFAEKLVVPFIYDRIVENYEEDIITVYNGNKLTYVDLDPRSIYYGNQLVPAVLEYAGAFNEEYYQFAECGLDGFVGYLPRNCRPRQQLSSWDLLTKKQVECLFSQQGKENLYKSANNKVLELTGYHFQRVLKPIKNK